MKTKDSDFNRFLWSGLSSDAKARIGQNLHVDIWKAIHNGVAFATETVDLDVKLRVIEFFYEAREKPHLVRP